MKRLLTTIITLSLMAGSVGAAGKDKIDLDMKDGVVYQSELE